MPCTHVRDHFFVMASWPWSQNVFDHTRGYARRGAVLAAAKVSPVHWNIVTSSDKTP